jgi:hypothetical protein
MISRIRYRHRKRRARRHRDEDVVIPGGRPRARADRRPRQSGGVAEFNRDESERRKPSLLKRAVDAGVEGAKNAATLGLATIPKLWR